MPVNYRQLRLELDRQSPKAIYRLVKPRMEKAFEQEKERMLQALDEHPVTKELDRGPKTGGSVVGGNLFSFLGFYADQDPVEPVRETLERDVRLNTSQISREVKANTIIFKIPVRMPTLATFHQKIAKLLPLEWTTRAYTHLIERGISGLPHYLFNNRRNFRGRSRSGTAIQVPPKLRDGSDKPRRWVSEILANFRERLSRVRRR